MNLWSRQSKFFFLEYQFKLYQRDESLLLIFALSHINDPRSLVSFSLHYGIPAISTIKLVNNLSESKHSTLLLLNPVRLKQYNTILPICFTRGRKPLLSGVGEMSRGERAFLQASLINADKIPKSSKLLLLKLVLLVKNIQNFLSYNLVLQPYNFKTLFRIEICNTFLYNQSITS